MAIIPESQYPGKIDPADAEYPYGKARNITLPGDGTGTPWEAALVNDLFGFQQSLLNEAGIVPTGNPEKVGQSQYLDALRALSIYKYNASTTYAQGQYALTSTAIYRSLVAGNVGNDPDTDDGTKWEKAPTREELDERTLYVSSLGQLAARTPKAGQQATVSGGFAGLYEFVASDLSTEIDENPEPGFYVPPDSNTTGTSGAWVRQEAEAVQNNTDLSPVFIEQFINGFGGRGMLAAETINVTTEQAITSTNSAGETSIGVASTGDLDAGGRITIYHDTVDRYETYFILSLTATTIGIAPGLRYGVTTNSRVERTWYNRAHPGKFYMRRLAQEIARGIEYKNAAPGDGRLYFTQFDSDPTDANDQATAINGAGIAYVDELNVSQGVIDAPLESSIGRALFIAVDADGEGAYFPSFNTFGVTDAVISCVIMCRSPDPDLVIQVRDDDGFLQAKIPVPKITQRVATKLNFPVKLPARTKNVRLEVVAESGVTAATSVIVDQVEVYPATGASNEAPIRKDRRYTVVALGDSWVAGDLVSTPEREPITQQLAKELPLSRIVNAGVGGNKVQDLLARFDTDVVPFNPDFVVINTGTNDAYNPASATFDPNSIDFFEYTYNQLLARVLEIGARPIIIGMPALAQEDAQVPTLAEWELNDRAKTYSRFFWKRFSAVPEFLPDTSGSQTWTPVLEINGVTTGITYTSRSGTYERVGDIVYFTLNILLSSKGAGTGLVTISGFPISAKSGVVVPMATTAVGVSAAPAIQAVLNISAGNKLRLQLPEASGTVAATDANLTNTTSLWVAGSYPAFDA